MFTVNTEYETYNDCIFELNRYTNNDHVAVEIYCEEGPLASITTNIPGIELYDRNYSCVDTNNCPWAEELIEELGIGEPIGISLRSGFCTYPVYKFDIKKIQNIRSNDEVHSLLR